MDEKIPALVAALAAQVKMTPISWNIQPDRVVIVFEQGPKLFFNHEPEPALKPEPKHTPVKEPKTPATKKK